MATSIGSPVCCVFCCQTTSNISIIYNFFLGGGEGAECILYKYVCLLLRLVSEQSKDVLFVKVKLHVC